MNQLAQIQDHYIRHRLPRARSEAAYFGAGSARDRITKAALARTANGRKHKHQWRIPNARLEAFARSLLGQEPRIVAARTFAELLAIVESARTAGIGILAIYDTTVRLGAGQGVDPDAIYMHAGTRKGAINLGLDTRRKFIPRTEMPPGFARLSASGIEDVLCTYARYIGQGAAVFDDMAKRALRQGCDHDDATLGC